MSVAAAAKSQIILDALRSQDLGPRSTRLDEKNRPRLRGGFINGRRAEETLQAESSASETFD
jgi:hypothetical protein